MTRTLKAPLFTSWETQYVRLNFDEVKPGDAATLQIDGKPAEFQYTGNRGERGVGAEVLLRFGFDKDQSHTITLTPGGGKSATDMSRVEIHIDGGGASIGIKGREIQIPGGAKAGEKNVPGPLGGYAGFPLTSRVSCAIAALESRRLFRTNDGPLFTDYELVYQFAEHRQYVVSMRCYRHEPIVEIAERFGLGMDAQLELTFNPHQAFDKIVSHGSFDFQGEDQPLLIEDLGKDRPKDVLCRLQMPAIGEYTVPNNRGWFAFFNSRDEKRGMMGMRGLYGARWTRPVENVMRVLDRAGKAVLEASLNQGERFWLLYAGPLETKVPEDRTSVFYGLQGRFNEMRLDEHLDLTGEQIFDANSWEKPGFFDADYRAIAKRAVEHTPGMQRLLKGPDFHPGPPHALRALLGDEDSKRALTDALFTRFEKWVRQFQGYRTGESDYGKCVIGFSRVTRDFLVDYELLRKDRALSDDQVRKLNSYFAFAARRIMDEGRWPHSKTWLHPNHPDSTRDYYSYPGEHKPDKLVWTNCLPNFQSDPTTALGHLSAIFPEHPDAMKWRRFAIDDLERNLDAYCSPSGAWEESPNYAAFTFYYFLVTFRALKRRWGIDYFNDARMRRFAGWLTRFVTPPDKRVDGKRTMPGIGNSFIPSGSGPLLSYAAELPEGDELRRDLIAVYQRYLPDLGMSSDQAMLYAATDLVPPKETLSLRPLASENMIDLGVMMRHAHDTPKESLLTQKIGFFKDHYEGDETAFDWYAKGTPTCMDHATYTPDAAAYSAHNLVEIPDADPLTRGYLKSHFFSELVDFSHSEVPIGLKLSYGRVRTFAEVDGPPQKPLFFYIGDETPQGPKTWKNRLLMYVKPDYLVIFDRVFGGVPHRYNLHFTGDEPRRDGSFITSKGRFDLDLKCFVQTPQQFDYQSGVFEPGPGRFGKDQENYLRQGFFRLYNNTGDRYRTVLFALERDRNVSIERIGTTGVKVITPQYTDVAFVNDEIIDEKVEGIHFVGRVGWVRKTNDGQVIACVQDGDLLEAHGIRIDGMGPYTYNMDGKKSIHQEGVPRKITVK